jgi:hypothetical protein
MTPLQTLPSRTRHASAILKWISLAAIAAGLAASAAFGVTDEVIAQTWNQLAPDAAEAVRYSETKKNMLVVLAAVLSAGWVLVLLGAARVFGAFETGDVISDRTARALRFFGLMVMAAGGLQLVAPTLLTLAMTYDNPPGLRTFTISLNGQVLILMLTGLIALITGQILTQAREIAEENKQFV